MQENHVRSCMFATSVFVAHLFVSVVRGGWIVPEIPVRSYTFVHVSRVVPDWGWYDSETNIELRGEFSLPPGYQIINSTIQFTGPTGVILSTHGSSHSATTITAVAPRFQLIGEHCFKLSVNVGTFAESNRFDIAAPEVYCFTATPHLDPMASVSVHNGPPSGGTAISFEFGMNPRTVEVELACAFGDKRTPVTYVFPADPSEAVSGTCTSPLAESDQYLCIQLVPGNTSFTEYPTVQTGDACVGGSIFNYYAHMPIVDSLYPRSGIYTGETAVVVTGVNFPDQRSSNGGVRCKFGPAGVVNAARLNETAVICDPSPYLASSNAIQNGTAPLTISFNSGVDYSPYPLTFQYVPVFVIDSILPSTGVSQGGTLVDLSLITERPDVSMKPLFGPKGVCAGTAKILASFVSSDFSRMQFHTEALQTVMSVIDPSIPTTVQVSILQEDDQCGPSPVGFSYHPPWTGTSATPTVITGGSLMRINVTGTKFFSSPEAVCSLSAKWPMGSRLHSSLPACTVVGTFEYQNTTNGFCEVDLDAKTSIYECGYLAAASVIPLTDPSEDILWEALTMNVAVAMNGRDFATVSRTDGSVSQPTTVQAIRLPVIEAIDPLFGFDYGGFMIEVKLRTGVAWHATLCVFTSPGRRVDVKASPYGMRSVLCTAPRWSISSDSLTETVSVQLQINPDEVLTDPFSFTFRRSPTVHSFHPREGPRSGNTDLTLQTNGLGTDLFPPNLPWSLQCVFGQTKAVTARIVSGSEVRCKTPSYSSNGPVTFDLSLNWQTGNSNRVAQMSLMQSVFRFLSTDLGIDSVSPLLGPITGGTVVVVTTTIPLPETGLLRCVFGYVSAVGEAIGPYSFSCKSPALSAPGTVVLSISLDGQPASSLAGQSYLYKFYRPPSIGLAIPAFGTSIGGTKVLIEGAYFLNTTQLSCKFGDKIVPVSLYVSSEQIVCISPGGALGAVSLSVANNGVDFTSVTDSAFGYVESQPLLTMTPTLGPITGGTTVHIKSEFGLISSSVVQSSLASGGPRCTFGSRSVGGKFVNLETGEIACVTPSVPVEGIQSVTVNYNGQEAAFVSQSFLYHNVSTLSDIDPPMAPLGVPSTVTITGSSFVNSETLTVRFGAPSVGYIDVPGLWISDTQVRCNPPSVSPAGESILRVPVMVSNNGQDFVPSSINNWSPDDDSFAVTGVAQYYTFHFPIVLHSVSPPYSTIIGGGFVSVHGGPFLASPTLACGFDRIVSDSDSPIFISSTHILCPVPNVWRLNAPVSSTVRLQVALVPNRWSDSFLAFIFLVSNSPPGQYVAFATSQVWSGQPVPCDPGYMCESSGMTAPVPCPSGTYQPFPNQLQCMPCPRGFYCPHVRMVAPIVCSGGWVCDEEGLSVPYRRCPAGYVCLVGTGSTDPVPDEPYVALAPSNMTSGFNAPYRCLLGMYCMEGTASLVSILSNFSTPQPCYQGYYCPPGSASPFGAGAAPLGRYSPAPLYPGVLCPSRHFCGPSTGNIEPTVCPAGTYNPLSGQHNCTLSPEGSIAPAPMLAAPILAQCGYVANRKGVSSLSVDDLCPAGTVCGQGTASAIEPKICTELSKSDPSLCDASIGQVYYDALGSFVPSRLNASAAHCCWNSTLVHALATRIEKVFASMPSGGAELETLAARRFRQTLETKHAELVTNPLVNPYGFDGRILIGQVNRASLATEFRVHISSVRERILMEIERFFSFKSPDPCPVGAFCNPGTCPFSPISSP